MPAHGAFRLIDIMIGDGGESTDSRAFGALPAELLLGVVVARFPG